MSSKKQDPYKRVSIKVWRETQQFLIEQQKRFGAQSLAETLWIIIEQWKRHCGK
jgi:hypothetical protein